MFRFYFLICGLFMLLLETGLNAAEPLPSWNESSSKTAILNFVTQVTKAGSDHFVAPEDRVAVFDNDGCLWCEQPFYSQLAFAIYRVKKLAPEHPGWNREEPFRSILLGDTSKAFASGHKGIAELIAASHSGMTATEFSQAVEDWAANDRHPRFERSYIECVYQPQLELLAYLRENGFKTYIVSGGGIDFMRPWTERVYGIPPEQVVGSSIKSVYEVRDGIGVVVKKPELNFVDDKEGKPVGIHHHIGKRPILAVGNSDGDFQMLEYTTTGTGPRMGILIHHDDAAREYAYDRDSHVGKLNKGLDEADSRGWVLVSMKQDWKQIFPPAE
ncbi:MAG: haloacid dehalogenase-like hydrolase [Planctomycetaceae bacterium]|nr:haloacid dehalogenase-like hydrolase [Planctomycetaceae bacterium]